MTTTSDRVVRQEDSGRAALRALRVSSGGATTTVFSDDRRGVYVPTRRPTAADILTRPPKFVYTVDTAEHPVRIEVDPPSKEEAFFFHAVVVLVWQVQDAVAAVISGLTYPEAAYRPHVEDLLRRIARKHPIENSAAAEREMNHEFAVPLPTAQGVVVTRCTVQLSLDTQTRQHKASRTLATRSEETRELEHKALTRDSELRETEVGLLHRLERQEEKHKQDLARLGAEHEQRLLAERMKFYADALAGGHVNLIALKLAGSNDDVDDVIRLIMQQRNLDFDGARGTLTAMVEQGLVNRSQVQDILARINSVMADHLTTPAFALTSPPASPAALSSSSSPSAARPVVVEGTVGSGTATQGGAAARVNRVEEKAAEDEDRDAEDHDEDGPL